MSQQEIYAPDLRKYRTEIPNLVDDMGLDPFAFRLLVHYYRVGKCWENTRTTAKRCAMSVGKVSETRRVLARMGLIHIRETGQGSLKIRVRDIWPRNFAHFAREKSDGEGAKRAASRASTKSKASKTTLPTAASNYFLELSKLTPPGEFKAKGATVGICRSLKYASWPKARVSAQSRSLKPPINGCVRMG